MKVYLGNKMSGMPFFNAPWFDKAADRIRQFENVSMVFNPADRDRERGFEPMSCPTGSFEEAQKAGFVLRDALHDDYAWITRNSDGLVVGSQWRDSPGTISEIAVHQALRLPVWEYDDFIRFHLKTVPPILDL